MTKTEMEKNFLGKRVSFFKKNYSESLYSAVIEGPAKIISGYILGYKSYKDNGDGVGFPLLLTDDGYIIYVLLREHRCDIGFYYCVVDSKKPLSKKKINYALKNNVFFDYWMYFNTYEKDLVRVSGLEYEGKKGWEDYTQFGFEYFEGYKKEIKKYDISKCIRKDNPDYIKKTILILNRVKNNGESIDDKILMYHEYEVVKYEIENQQVIGYYIKHADETFFIPKECLYEASNIDSDYDKLISDYSDSLNPELPDYIKILMINNFKNEYELTVLKFKNEINNIRFYNTDNSIKIITENIKNLNEKTQYLHDLINSNYTTLNKKIDGVEIELKKYIDLSTGKLKEQIDMNYERANNYRLYKKWVLNKEIETPTPKDGDIRARNEYISKQTCSDMGKMKFEQVHPGYEKYNGITGRWDSI